jgi:hypothetical protein
MASTYLTRTLGTPTDENRWTYSFWTKISKTGDYSWFLQTGTNGSNNVDAIHINSANSTIRAYGYPGSQVWELITNAKYRDPSAWYHIVIAYNSDEATSSNRAKMWVNGVQQTSFSTEIYPSLGANSGHINKSGSVYYIGSNIDANLFSEMLMTHLHFIDGTAYDASTFGETDATTGIWEPITEPSVTYGTNGFFLKFENSGSMGLDSSPNGNNLTVNGTLTQTVDTPSNVFATMNPLDNFYAGGTFTEGNLQVTSDSAGYTYNTSTIGASKGKWYWECKWSAQPTGSSNQVLIGIAKRTSPSTTTWLGSVAYTYGYQGSDGHVKVSNGNAVGSVATTYSIGDIISVALDLDNLKIHFAKNGVWTNSSVPASNSGGVTITAPDSTSGDSGFYFPSFGDGNTSLQETGQFNFGNGYFGTTAVSSATSDESGLGIFEYTVPSGYYALCTKNINEQEYD